MTATAFAPKARAWVGLFGSAGGIDTMHQSLRWFEDEELRDRVSVSRDHQYEYERIPQGKAVEGGRHASLRVQRDGVGSRCDWKVFFVTAMERRQVGNE